MKNLRFNKTEYFFAVLLMSIVFVGSPSKTAAQKMVDITVAVISDSVSKPELITYSDLLWQLALQPDAPINPPTSEDLNRTLQLLTNQRLFALEAERLPRNAPNDDEIKIEIDRVIRLFPSISDFENRLRAVGFESIRDENFRRIMRQRVAIEKYLEFRFRSFVIITSEQENRYYREVFVPEFRRRNPGLIVPPLENVRDRINKNLIEQKVEEDIEKFLDDAKNRASIEILHEI